MGGNFWVMLAGVIIAVVGLGVAYKELRHVSKQLSLVEKTATANFIFELDRKYDDIFEARKAAANLEDEVKKQMADKNLQGEDKFLTEMTSTLAHIKEKNVNRYHLIKQVFDFCETVGFFMTHGYIDPEDVYELWGPAIADWGRSCHLHISWRQQNEGADVYKYFLLAAAECQRRRGEKS